MRIPPESRGGIFCLLLVLVLCSTANSLGSSAEVEVVGYAESSTIKNPNAFAGLRVTVECKAAETKSQFVTRGSGEVDEKGKFSLNIPHDIVGEDGTLKETCYAQLHSASGSPCPAHDGLEASKIVFSSKSAEKHVLGLKQNLKFSPEICVSKFFFPKIKKPCPPKIKLPPIKKLPTVIPKKPCPPKIAHKPAGPIHKPSVPVHKPVFKPPMSPKTPVVIPKIHFPPKKVLPPVHKSPVVIPKIHFPPKAPVPIYKPPVVVPKKPCPPLPKLPPIVIPKKPCPPLPKLPPIVFPKKPCPPLPPFPKIPPFTHPKFGKWPPLPKHP